MVLTSTGEYRLVLTTEAGCDSIITLLLTINQGIDTPIELEDLSIYPNPTLGKVTISADDVLKIDVYDVHGTRLATFENTNVIDLTPYSTGTYTLYITLPEGSTLRKVIKK